VTDLRGKISRLHTKSCLQSLFLNSLPIDELGKGALAGWWSRDMSLNQSMQVSMATLRAATTRHCHTDRVSGDANTTPYTYQVRETQHAPSMNGTQDKLRSHTVTAGKQKM